MCMCVCVSMYLDLPSLNKHSRFHHIMNRSEIKRANVAFAGKQGTNER